MMTKRAFAFGLLALPACTGGGLDTSTVGQDIIGGEITQTSEWKSVVALEETPGQWFCTGTLITDQWVLTAAHCMDGETAANLHVRFDSADVNDGQNGHAVAVAEIHSNPAFDFDAWDNDVALVKLAQPVTDRAPTPIDRDAISFGAHVIDVGYGVSDNNDGGGGILRKVEKVTADCAGANDAGIVNDNLLCMDATDGRGSCYGDSGGPAFMSVNGAPQVAGITSGGTGELCGDGWDLYTSVHGELAFIDEVLGAVTPPDPGTGDGSGSGSGTGSGDGSGSNDPSDPKPGDGDDGGCAAAGGSSSALFVIAFAAVLRRRRRTGAKPA